ncbi:hypothetical protein CHS0354_021545 [Potamilus streckersoni]|uniref:Centrosomal protein of 97 kDa n=1 Tax=Potamilus streckersoni TaxID=2493646 RepID=A0AAE0VZ64_9BIVA|nr:hypothetical protein CHS0354_021545 [Potamilus streckersoni]
MRVVDMLNENPLLKQDADEGGVLDLSQRGLSRLEVSSHDNPTTIIADKNNITKIENLEKCPNLRQLSLVENRLVQMIGVAKLKHLTVLNLSNNSLVSIDGLRDLVELTWLNLSGNSVKVIEGLQTNVNLQHLDLSDNSISSLSDISMLQGLQTLLLHGNILTTLRQAPQFLPSSIVILSLAENEISDINEVSYLSCFAQLQQLSVMNNPFLMTTPSMPGFDYRPFVVNWCVSLEILDGYLVSEKERLKSEWLYSQGRGRHFKVGQHAELVQYLASACPLTTSAELESAEDAKLAHILSKQRYHQHQLQQEQPQLGSARHSQTASQQVPPLSQSHTRPNTAPSHPNSPVAQHHVVAHSKGPVRAWSGSNPGSPAVGHSPNRQGHTLNDLSVQDVTSDDYDSRSTTSLLDSESIYLPVDITKSPIRPMTAPSVSTPNTANFVNIFSKGDNRPATTLGNKYVAYDSRQVRPLNQEILKGYLKPNFEFSPPQHSGNEPVVGTKKKTPPTALAQDYDSSQDASQIEAVITRETETNIPSNEINQIKEKAEKRTKQFLDKASEVKKSGKRQQLKGHDKNESGAKTGIPVAKYSSNVSRTHSDYIPGKYASIHKPPATESDTKTRPKELQVNSTSSDNLERKSVKREVPTDLNNKLEDSGFISRPNSDAVLVDYTLDEQKAALRIQKMWRGYWAREHNVEVVRVRQEIRARRAEDHIVVLRSELDRQRKLYEQERQLRTLQLEAIRHLWKEVQSLQAWKTEVLSSQTLRSVDTNKHEYGSYNCSQEIENTLARAEMLNHMEESGKGILTSTNGEHKQIELEKTCASLQLQVSQLQEALRSVSTVLIQGGIIPSPVQSPSPGRQPQPLPQPQLQTGTVPHSLSPYPSEEEDVYFQRVPQPGFPTPPRNLRLEHRGDNALVLRWHPSKILDAEGKEMNKPLLGYRVYINDKDKALIAGTKQKALVEGLDPNLTYKIYVKAVSSLGESNSSDVIMAALAKGLIRRRSSSSDSNRSYESDKEMDSNDSARKHSLRKDKVHKSQKLNTPKTGGQEASNDSSLNEAAGPADSDRPTSVKSGHNIEGILTQPKMHKRTHSKDYQNRPFTAGENYVTRPKEAMLEPRPSTARLVAQESQGFSFDSRQAGNVEGTSGMEEHQMSSTYTIDGEHSILNVLGAKGASLVDINSEESSSKDSDKSRRKRKSKDVKDMKGNISDSSSSVVSEKSDTKVMNIVHGSNEMALERKESVASDSETTQTHSRRRSKDLQNQMFDIRREDMESAEVVEKKNGAKISPTGGSQGVPIIDGRKRQSSGSRPASPTHTVESIESRSSVTERRRLPVADVLEQRFLGKVVQSTSSTASSSATLTQSVMDNNDLPTARKERNLGSMENISIVVRSSHDNRSPTERFSPTGSDRRRILSTSSESDLPETLISRQLDMDKKPINNNGIVAKLLQKLQTFSKSQEDPRKKIQRKVSENVSSIPSEEERPPSRVHRISGGSETSEPAIEKAQVHSDGSSGNHSDDSQSVKRAQNRTHRRTNSDQRATPVRVIEQSPPSTPTQRTEYNPVIRDREKNTSSPVLSSNVKRHASFHGILPSKQQDLVTKRSGSHENLCEGSLQQNGGKQNME